MTPLTTTEEETMNIKLNNMTLEVNQSTHELEVRNIKSGASVRLIPVTKESYDYHFNGGVDSPESTFEMRSDMTANSPVNDDSKYYSWIIPEYVGKESQSDNWTPDLDPKGFSDFSLRCILRWVNRHIPTTGTPLPSR